MSFPGPLERFRDPAYTGENRCLPCTAVNVAMALGAGVVVGVFNPVAGLAVAVLAGLVILFRGYLVPGTPTLTKRYFPVWLLAWFGKAPSPDTEGPLAQDDTDEPTASGPDPQTRLARAGLLVECPNEDDVCLEERFRSDWTAAMVDLRADHDRLRETVGDLLDEPADRLAIEPDRSSDPLGEDPRSPVRAARTDRPADILGFWESYGALLADAGATAVLADYLPDWSELETTARNGVLAGLRIFVDECPGCGGPVAMGEEVRESCCWSGMVVQVACERCGATYFEADEETIGADSAAA